MTVETSPLSPESRDFITRWGEVGRAWGLPRSAAQIHGLLLTASEPLTAEEISEALSIARSNVSTSVKELRAMGIIRAASVPGERRERLEALDDPAEAAANLRAWRQAREVDPAIAALTAAAGASKGAIAKRLSAYAAMAGGAEAEPAPRKKKKKKKKSA